jgi:hypothetical protein
MRLNLKPALAHVMAQKAVAYIVNPSMSGREIAGLLVCSGGPRARALGVLRPGEESRIKRTEAYRGNRPLLTSPHGGAIGSGVDHGDRFDLHEEVGARERSHADQRARWL